MKFIDMWLAPLKWFDITHYDDGTPVSSDDRFMYRITSLALILAVVIILVFVLGAIL